MDTENLIRKLHAFHIQTNWWGMDDAKSVDDLCREINEKESSLMIVDEETLIRVANVVTINVRYIDPVTNQEFHLVEDMQKFKDGRIRRRKTGNSIGEKMKFGEDVARATKRALFEETGMVLAGTQAIFMGEEMIERQGQSYPGLISRYYFNHVDILIGQDQYREEGYIEKGPNMDTFFVWEEVSSSQNE